MLTVVWVIVQNLFEKYQSKYVKHENVYEELPQKMENVLRIIHNEYLISRQPTTHQRISDILSYIQPENLNQLVREYEYEQKKQNKQHLPTNTFPHPPSFTIIIVAFPALFI